MPLISCCFSSSFPLSLETSSSACSFSFLLVSYVSVRVPTSWTSFSIFASSSDSSFLSLIHQRSLAADISRSVWLSAVISLIELLAWAISFFSSSSQRLSLLTRRLSFSTSRLYYFSVRVFYSRRPQYFFSRSLSSSCSLSCYFSQVLRTSSSFCNSSISLWLMAVIILLERMNPEDTPRLDLTARTMFEYDTHKNIPWNFHEYDPEKEYLDPADIVLQRKYSSQKKGEKTNLYVTKKGFYMDYDLKVAKSIPGANVYKMNDSWDGEKDRKKSSQKKLDPKVIKYTFSEQIEIEQKNRKKPGIGTYYLNKTDDQIKAEIKKLSEKKKHEGQKRYFYEDTEFVSNLVPGSGAHNPHEIRSKSSLNKTDHKFWIAKHKQQAETERKKRASQPDVGTYKPLPALYTTFTKLQVTPKKQLEKRNGFGTDEKFAYLRQAKVKNKIKEVRPSAATYNTFIDWPVKTDKEGVVNKHKVNWHNRISKGFSHSVYH